MKQINLFFKTMLILCALVWSGNCAWAAPTTVLSWSRSGSNNTYTEGFTFSATAAAKTGYYQDASSGAGYIMLYHTKNSLFSSTPETITFTATVGGGSGNKNLSNPVYVCLVNSSGTEISGTQTVVTNKVTTASGDTYNVTLDASKGADACGVKIYHEKESGYNVRYFSFSLAYEEATLVSGTTAAPTISGEVSFLNSTEVTITNDASADGASIYYTLNGDDPTTTASATCFEYTAPFTINATTTVKAIAKLKDTNASAVVSKVFTKIIPQTVADALDAIDALANNGTIDNQYVHGIVVSIISPSVGDDGTIKYYISDDGTSTNQLQVYKGKGLDNVKFTDLSELQVGDDVVVFGQLKKYVSGKTITPEFNEGNYLVSQIHKTTPTFSLDVTKKSLDAYTHETVDVALTTNTDGVISYESSNTDVATVALKSAGIYTITAQAEGTATITIKSAVSSNYAPASATVSITVTDNRADAGISFASASVSKTWGESFTGQELTNTNSLAVTYSSTDEAVATVSSTGVVTMKKAGTTIIKATFAGNDAFKAAVAQYTLNISKAEPGLSFAKTSFDIELGADGNNFVAPALVNPNKLTVQYSSSNEKVAIVDENSGEVVIETGAEGTATITAYFAGDDCYKGGNAKYTINIIDHNKKGSKYNPYTVAEVLNGTATGSNIYVQGYIVGEYVGKSSAPRTSGFGGNTNLAIADDFSSSPAVSNCIPVELPDSPSSIRSNWGLKSNPSKVGYKILFKGNADKYFSVNGIKGTNEINLIGLYVAISEAGLATYASDEVLDYTNVEDIEAYIAIEGEKGKVNLKRVKKVPAATGVLLRALNGKTDFDVPVTTADADKVDGNAFVRGEGKAVESGKGPFNYILSKKGNEIGFYHANNNVVANNRAYLQLTTNNARLNLNFDEGELTGIEEVSTQMNETKDAMFDLQGRQVIKPAKGLYIKNGKRVVIK